MENILIEKNTIISIIGIVVVSLLISGIYFSLVYYSSLRDIAYENLEHSVESDAKALDQALFSLNNLSFQFSACPSIQNWCHGKTSFDGDNFETFGNIAQIRKELENSLMFNDAWLSKYIDQVYLMIENEYYPLVSRKAFSLPLSYSINKRVYEQSTEQSFPNAFFLDSETETVFMFRHINDVKNEKQITFIFTINPNLFARNVSRSTNSITYLIYNDVVLWSSTPNVVGEKVNEKEKYAVLGEDAGDTADYITAFRHLKNEGFYVSTITPKKHITKTILPSIMAYVPIMLVIILLFATIAGITTGSHTKFVKDMLYGLEKIRKEDYEVTLPNYKSTDLNMISSAFNKMSSSISTLIKTVYQSELSLKENEIKLLQSQMNPHFLINILATISTNALMNDNTEIYQMTTALSEILETSLYSNGGGNLITVEKELEYIDCYLFLQQVRFQDYLKYEINIESNDLKKLYIPKLCIEPIVENSIVHGIEKISSDGFVKLNIFTKDNNLIVTIEDNGVGFDVESTAASNAEEKTGKHIGIMNTNRRIKLLFGNEYGIEFQSEKNVKTIAYITLPIIKNPLLKGAHDEKSPNC